MNIEKQIDGTLGIILDDASEAIAEYKLSLEIIKNKFGR